MKTLITVVLLSIAALSYGISSFDQENQAFEAFSASTTWAEFESAYSRFNKYDDGYIAQEISSKSVELITNDFEWLRKYGSNDVNKEFSNFVFKHLDETMSFEEFNNIIDVHKQHCLNEDDYICAKLHDAIKSLK